MKLCANCHKRPRYSGYRYCKQCQKQRSPGAHPPLHQMGLLPAGDEGEIMRACFEIYQDRKKQFRWRLLAGSEIHRVIIADSGESYTRRRDARRAATRVKTLVKNAIVA